MRQADDADHTCAAADDDKSTGGGDGDAEDAAVHGKALVVAAQADNRDGALMATDALRCCLAEDVVYIETSVFADSG